MTTIDDEWESWSKTTLGRQRYLQPDTYRLCFDGGWHARHVELEKLEERIRKLGKQQHTLKNRADHAFMYAELRQSDCGFVESKLDAIGRIAFSKDNDTDKVTNIIDVLAGWLTERIERT